MPPAGRRSRPAGKTKPAPMRSSEVSRSVSREEQTHTPIPAFYCCYLLRSSVNHARLYVGSTPNPARRLAQHNGVTKGGAKVTSKSNLRPWEMVAIVQGFMSRTAALQFEWAWQHTKDSRHLKADEKKGEAAFSRSLQSHLANLHLLLRSASFSRWPLKVCFFSEDVYHHWRLWSERIDGILPDNIGVSLDTGASSDPSTWRTSNDAGSSSVRRLDISYGNVKEHLEKSWFMLERSENIDCGVCKKPTLLMEDLVVICPQRDCRCCSHIACLSERFLQDAGTPNQFVPIDGSCPACKATIQWAPLAKELSLRICPEREIKTILKTKKKQLRCPESRSEGRRKEKIDRAASGKTLREQQPVIIDSVVDADLGSVGEGHRDRGYGEYEQDDVPLDDSWIDAVTLGSDAEDGNKPQLAAQQKQSRAEIVIEDSEWDDPDIMD